MLDVVNHKLNRGSCGIFENGHSSAGLGYLGVIAADTEFEDVLDQSCASADGTWMLRPFNAEIPRKAERWPDRELGTAGSSTSAPPSPQSSRQMLRLSPRTTKLSKT